MCREMPAFGRASHFFGTVELNERDERKCVCFFFIGVECKTSKDERNSNTLVWRKFLVYSLDPFTQ